MAKKGIISIMLLMIIVGAIAGCSSQQNMMGNNFDTVKMMNQNPGKMTEVFSSPDSRQAMVKIMSSDAMRPVMADMMKTPEMQKNMVLIMSDPNYRQIMVDMMANPAMKQPLIAILQDPRLKPIAQEAVK